MHNRRGNLHRGSLMAIAVLAWQLLGGCVASPSYEDTAFRCDEDPLCPDGFTCVDGVCTRPTGDPPDAAVPNATIADAAPTPPDAAPEPPDAAPAIDAVPPSPDATPTILTLSFGENDDDDVTGVTADTYVTDLYADENFGASVVLKMDGEPHEVSLVRFDISAIPAGSEILEARLVVWTRSGDALQEGWIQVYQMLESWTEGNSMGVPGVANYTWRKSATPWTTAGVGPGSRDTVILAEFVPDTNDTRWDVGLATGPVQSWVDTAVNYGLALATNNGNPRGCEFHSSESAELFRRPRLVVTFQPPSP